MQLQDIERIAKYQRDNWSFVDGEITNINLENKVVSIGGLELKMNDLANKNVYERLNMLGTYSDFQDSDDREMLQRATDYCIIHKQKTDSRAIYDINTNEAKAIKSERYTPVWNHNVLQRSLSKYENAFHDKGSYIDDKRMSINFSNVETHEIKGKNASVGEIVGFGSQVWNSDVGLSSLGVGQFMLRLACTNGMTSRDSINVARLSHSSNNLMEKLSYAMNSILNAKDMIKVISRSIDRPAIVENIRDFTKIIKGIPSRHDDGIVMAHGMEPMGLSPEGINGWGIYNAITRYVSHIYPQYATFDNNEANQILAAAYPLLTV